MTHHKSDIWSFSLPESLFPELGALIIYLRIFNSDAMRLSMQQETRPYVNCCFPDAMRLSMQQETRPYVNCCFPDAMRLSMQQETRPYVNCCFPDAMRLSMQQETRPYVNCCFPLGCSNHHQMGRDKRPSL